MLDPADLIRVADLLRIGAETARLFSDTAGGNGRTSRITALSIEIEAAATELASIGREMIAGKASEEH